MTRTRFTLAVLLAALAASSAHAGLFPRKAKIDAARAKHLVDVLRSDPDERKRKAAVAELRDADPRTHGEIMSAVVTSLQRDPAAGVRAESADTLRHYKVVSPVAGVALETAAESDSSPVVRDAAQQALWEYHLGGYRSAKGTDGFAGQTAEPPMAKPVTRMARAAPAAVVVPASAVKPVEVVALSPPKTAPPPVPAMPPPTTAGIRTVVSAEDRPAAGAGDDAAGRGDSHRRVGRAAGRAEPDGRTAVGEARAGGGTRLHGRAAHHPDGCGPVPRREPAPSPRVHSGGRASRLVTATVSKTVER